MSTPGWTQRYGLETGRSTLIRVGQVASPRVQYLYRYWSGQADQDGLMPRQAFDPVDLGSLLSNVLFIEVASNPCDLMIRVAGQEIEERYGRSLRGRSIFETFPLVRRKDTSHQWCEILADRQPKYRRGPMVFPNDRVFEAERIMLPLSAAGEGDAEDVAFILAAIFYRPLSPEDVELTAISATLIP